MPLHQAKTEPLDPSPVRQHGLRVESTSFGPCGIRGQGGKPHKRDAIRATLCHIMPRRERALPVNTTSRAPEGIGPCILLTFGLSAGGGSVLSKSRPRKPLTTELRGRLLPGRCWQPLWCIRQTTVDSYGVRLQRTGEFEAKRMAVKEAHPSVDATAITRTRNAWQRFV